MVEDPKAEIQWLTEKLCIPVHDMDCRGTVALTILYRLTHRAGSLEEIPNQHDF